MTAVDVRPAGQAERSKLRRELRRLDTVFFLISAMVVVDTIGAIAIGGAEAFTWLVVLVLCFFVPSALASAELGAAIPEEGGAYAWVRTAFGRFAGAITSILYWAGTPMWLGGSVTVVAIAVVERFLGGLGSVGAYAFGIGFVLAATLFAVIPLRYGKWVPTSGAIGQIVLLSSSPAPSSSTAPSTGSTASRQGASRRPSRTFIAIAPVLLYSFIGVELLSTAAEEMVDPRRDIPAAIARAGVCQTLMYAIPILAVLFVLPAEAGHVAARPDRRDGDRVHRVRRIVGPDGGATLTGVGAVVGAAGAMLFVWVLLASGSAWIIGAGRAQAAACLDGAGPPVLGRISARSGVPVVMGLVSGGVSLLAVVAGLALTSGDGQKYFSAALTVAIALIVLAYLLIFPAFVALRIRRPELARPFRVPGGTAGGAAGLARRHRLVALAALCLLWPGFGAADPDDVAAGGLRGRATGVRAAGADPDRAGRPDRLRVLRARAAGTGHALRG